MENEEGRLMMENPAAEEEAHRTWDKNNRPEEFIAYTLRKAYALMDEVYDTAKEHKIDLTKYMLAGLGREEEDDTKESNG